MRENNVHKFIGKSLLKKFANGYRVRKFVVTTQLDNVSKFQQLYIYIAGSIASNGRVAWLHLLLPAFSFPDLGTIKSNHI